MSNKNTINKCPPIVDGDITVSSNTSAIHGIDSLISKEVVGSFPLRGELADFTTEAQLGKIMSKIDNIYRDLIAIRMPFTPVFTFTKNETTITINICKKENGSNKILSELTLHAVKRVRPDYDYLMCA